MRNVPLPSKLCEAMASLAIAWKWPRFALVLLLSFHGIMRIGEILAALRRDLLLPADMLIATSWIAFMCGSLHQRLADAEVVRSSTLLCWMPAWWLLLKASSVVWPLNQNCFRTQVRLFESVGMNLGPDAALTPGCVRGGEAVFAYQQGTPIHDLMWHMRIQHVHTLQHYLQEMAAENILGRLTKAARASISASSALLPHLLDSVTHC